MKRFNDGKPYGGSAIVQGGGLTGATDTDYFYFFCPKCPGNYVMRILEYGVRERISENPYNSAFKKKAKEGFILAFKLYCENCKHTDFVKISNMGLQIGTLDESPSIVNA